MSFLSFSHLVDRSIPVNDSVENAQYAMGCIQKIQSSVIVSDQIRELLSVP